MEDGLGNAGGYADCEGDVEETRPQGNIICVWHRRKAPLPDAQIGKALSEMLLSGHHAA